MAKLQKRPSGIKTIFGTVATKSAQWAGSVWTFGAALLIVIVWGITGPIFGFSDSWQLIINTGTTIVTFLMVFLIQHAQNRDTRAIQLKLNELIGAVEGASNRLIDIEDLSEEELADLHQCYQKLSRQAKGLRQGAQTTVDTQEGDRLQPRAGNEALSPVSKTGDAARPTSSRTAG